MSTIAMPDSVRADDLPPGYPAYLAYVDGELSKNAAAVRARFPGARILTLTVLGGLAIADGCDIELGDLSPVSGAAWLRWRRDAGLWRPVAYASVSAMPDVLGELARLDVTRAQVRVFTAHYGQGKHICGPSTCAFRGLTEPADATQWTNDFRTPGGAIVDMSELYADFFGDPPAAAPVTWKLWPEGITLELGSSGDPVRVLQEACRLSAIRGVRGIAVDGDFGPQTLAAVRNFQERRGLLVDGIAGPRTRAKLAELGDVPAS